MEQVKIQFATPKKFKNCVREERGKEEKKEDKDDAHAGQDVMLETGLDKKAAGEGEKDGGSSTPT